MSLVWWYDSERHDMLVKIWEEGERHLCYAATFISTHIRGPYGNVDGTNRAHSPTGGWSGHVVGQWSTNRQKSVLCSVSG